MRQKGKYVSFYLDILHIVQFRKLHILRKFGDFRSFLVIQHPILKKIAEDEIFNIKAFLFLLLLVTTCQRLIRLYLYLR